MRIHILHEGETEKKLLRILDVEGKATKFNPFQHDVRKLERLVAKNDFVYIIYDTDTMGLPEIKKFKENIRRILKTTKKLILVQQTKNLEDEIVFACVGYDFRQVCRAFATNPPSNDNFKTRFIKTTNCLAVLQKLNFDKELLFTQSMHKDLAEFGKYAGKIKYRE